MSEDKRVTGNLPSFHFCFSYVGSGRDFIQGGWHTWIWRDALCEARRGCKGGFIKWFYFLAVVKGVFDITYLIKKHPSGNLDTIALAVAGISERAKAAFQKSKKTHICTFIYLSYVPFERDKVKKSKQCSWLGKLSLQSNRS